MIVGVFVVFASMILGWIIFYYLIHPIMEKRLLNRLNSMYEKQMEFRKNLYKE